MGATADCINTQSVDGRNATPLAIFNAVRYVLGGIELDPASDRVINSDVGAKRIYSIEDDGFSKDWRAKTAWLNPPGKTRSKGKSVSASQWFKKLYAHWEAGDVESAIALVYRAGSIGSLGTKILSHPICLTTSGVEAKTINGSGRFSFDLITEDGRKSQPQNTQSSLFFLLTRDLNQVARFEDAFSTFGVVKK